jgi:hypothetical protein
MSTKEIRILLDKYFEGESSLAEEQRLRTYFNEDVVDPDLKPFQPLFQYLHAAGDEQLSEGFEADLLQKIQEDQASNEAPIRFLSTGMWRAVAAAVALLVIALVFLPKLNPNIDESVAQQIDWEQWEVESEEEAYEKTLAALKLLSSKMNGGAETATGSISSIEKASDIFK